MFKVIAHLFQENGKDGRKLGQMVFHTGNLEAAEHMAQNVPAPIGCYINVDIYTAVRGPGYKAMWLPLRVNELEDMAEQLLQLSHMLRKPRSVAAE